MVFHRDFPGDNQDLGVQAKNGRFHVAVLILAWSRPAKIFGTRTCIIQLMNITRFTIDGAGAGAAAAGCRLRGLTINAVLEVVPDDVDKHVHVRLAVATHHAHEAAA